MERRLFEDLIESDVVAHKDRKGYTLPVSLTVHAVIIGAIIIVPLMTAEELPEPTTAVKAFFVEPAAPPPPPPPPPPPAPHVETKPKPINTPPPTTPKFMAPVEVPEEIKPEEAQDLGVEGGVAGGVEGGVAGGVVGGVVGGLPEAPPQVIHVSESQGPKKLKDVKPTYPQIAVSARVQGQVILECTISPQGRVTNVRVVRGVPLLDQSAQEAVKQWIYTPYLLNGVPVSVVMTVTVNFRLQ